MNCIVIHYSEIGLKGVNRPFFENKLINNIKLKTGKTPRKEYGRLVIDYVKVKGLDQVPGIAYFSPAIKTRLNINDIKKAVEKLADKSRMVKVSAKRSNKQFRLKSPEINKQVSKYLLDKGFNIDLKGDQEITVEIAEKHAYTYDQKTKGVGGLPVSVSGKLICLISGGIDSPVAAFKMIKRGCKAVLVHFYHTKQGVEKIKGLSRVLSNYQGVTKLYLIPFQKIQQKIITVIPAKYRMITYRRVMIKIAEIILKKEKAKGFVTGDNIGQVASQTLDNLRVIYSATSEPIFNPLSGFDKQEIVDEAKAIGTYDLSIQAYKDCCSFLVAQHPETKAKLEDVEKLESNLQLTEEIAEALKKTDSKSVKVSV